MINIETINDKCTGCGACANSCPRKCIHMQPDSSGFLFPSMDLEECIDCHQCEGVCEALNGIDNLLQENNQSKYYAAWATEEWMPPEATSGGIASVLSKNFIKIGYVFGAAFCKGVTELQQIECSTEADLERIAGSKYLQSNSSVSFGRVKELLVAGEKVLYIGTPCQIGGLKKYLKKEYEDLYTIDFFCHGVPSPLAWEKYVSYIEEKYRSKLSDYNFRAKLRGWGKLEQSATFVKKRIFRDIGPFNAYHTWFGKHLSIRSCCFQCQFRSDNRVSDITVADFWKIEQFYPDTPTKQGVSCVILNSDRGKDIFDNAIQNGQITSFEVSYDSVWKKRKTTQSNYDKPQERHLFLQDLRDLSPNDLVRKYPAQTLQSAVVDKFKSIIR